MSNERQTHTVQVAGLTRHFPLFEVAPGVRIAIVNILGDNELVQAASKALASLLADRHADVLITAESKSIPLAYDLSVAMKVPYVVLRKAYKPYMGNAIQADTLSITTGAPQTLYLDEKDQSLVKGHRVILVDDVISTGSTLQGMRVITDKAGGQVVGQAAIFTEGDRARWTEVIALGHLPVFVESGKH